MRLLQLSDPHLLADPRGHCRGRVPWLQLCHGLKEALAQARASGQPPDLLLISGDLCQDESWGGYVLLRELLGGLGLPAALLPGNHDHTLLLRAVLGRQWPVAPALLSLAGVDLLLLDSHRPGSSAGWLGSRQLAWLAGVLARRRRAPLLVALHHPPLPIGDAAFDAMALVDAPELWRLLQPEPQLRAVLFGHIHQHWQGRLPERPDVPLLGCPSSLCCYGPVQPCPLGRPQDPGGRLLAITADGELEQRLLRWPDHGGPRRTTPDHGITSVKARSANPQTG